MVGERSTQIRQAKTHDPLSIAVPGSAGGGSGRPALEAQPVANNRRHTIRAVHSTAIVVARRLAVSEATLPALSFRNPR
jgi:hypothetical protein